MARSIKMKNKLIFKFTIYSFILFSFIWVASPALAASKQKIFFNTFGQSNLHQFYYDNTATTTINFVWGVKNDDFADGGYYQLQVYFDDYNTEECLSVIGPITLTSSFIKDDVINITNHTGLSEIDILGTGTNTVDGQNCLTGTPNVTYENFAAANNPGGNDIHFGLPNSSTTLLIASSTPLTYGVNGFMGIILYFLSAAGGIYTFRKFLS